MNGEPPLGFVGLGAIGLPLARALLEASHRLVVFDIDGSKAELLGADVQVAGSPRDVADRVEVVFVSLPTPDVVREVACGQDGLTAGGRLQVYVDLSTTGVAVAREVAEVLAARGVAAVDAPVSGGVAGANARTLAVMAAGDYDAVQRVAPLLRTFGEKVFRVGSEPGHGQLAKVLNNLLSATAVAITSEALVVGATAGLEAQTLLDVFNAGSGRNTATSNKFPTHVLPQTFASGFRLALMAKDVELCLAEAHALGVPMRVGEVVQELWTRAAAESAPDADHTEFPRVVEGWT
ncbi:MAG TPA: NAD(P)-dependent oxidoreductase [Gaiellaceae bacterium]|nr:NAD(P)-dependent oxidoreductase [Gaiellaceae bacterium]